MNQDARTRKFVQLLTENERRLYAYILTLAPRWSDADDILQETNLRLWDEFDKYMPGTDFALWATRIAYFQVLTFRRHRHRDRHLFDERLLETVASAAADAGDESDALQQALADCMEKLSDTNRDLLRACYAAGAKIKDVAARLGRNPAATYQAVSRLRVALHQCVEETLHGEKEPLK